MGVIKVYYKCVILLVLLLVNFFNFVVYLVSFNKNWGYGFIICDSVDCLVVLLDLFGFCKIFFISKELGFIMVEFGVI